jgi:hypothetical protein
MITNNHIDRREITWSLDGFGTVGISFLLRWLSEPSEVPPSSARLEGSLDIRQ